VRQEEGRIHSEKCAVFIQECLEEAQMTASEISAIGVSNGPGSYTGLRVGLSIAKGLAYAQNIPIIALDSLEIMSSVTRKHYCDSDYLHLPMIDARRREVYMALYSPDGKELEPVQAQVIDEAWLEQWKHSSPVLLSGDGCWKVKEAGGQIPQWKETSVRASAENMGDLLFAAWGRKEFASTAYLTPKYLKKPNITRSNKTLL
jgi:tRNA threonylcarbamoyladenosine biosynthesis protein TsaB